MLSFLPKNPSEIMQELQSRFKARRRSLGYTQKELSTRSGVSLGSLSALRVRGGPDSLGVSFETGFGFGVSGGFREDLPGDRKKV